MPKSQYDVNLAGQPATKVRIVIGRRNQNKQANQELAYKVKAVADKTYPGLIKDIYIGQGMYNQELSPRSLLFEVGTYENDKKAAQTSANYLADVVSKSLFGGTIKSVKKPIKEYRTTPINYEKTKGQSKGMLWLVVVLVVGIVGYMFISSGAESSRQNYQVLRGVEMMKNSTIGSKFREYIWTQYIMVIFQPMRRICVLLSI